MDIIYLKNGMKFNLGDAKLKIDSYENWTFFDIEGNEWVFPVSEILCYYKGNENKFKMRNNILE